MPTVISAILTAILIATAASYMLLAWSHGSIFDGVRSNLEHKGLTFWVCGGSLPEGYRSWKRVRFAVWVTELLLCPFCLAPHLCLWLHVLCWLLGVPGAMAGLIVGPFASAALAVYLYAFILGSFFKSNDSSGP